MAAYRAARVSMVVGAAVLALKFLAWWLTGSVALYSDALESVVNVVAATAAFYALRLAAQPADTNHPWGHHKAEYFSAGLEGGLIVLAAGLIIRAAYGRLSHPVALESLGPGLAVSFVASAANGWLGLWLRRTGRRIGSPALSADGAHVLTDVVTTGGVLIGIGLARATGWWLLDPLVAIAVALHIVLTGWDIMRGSVEGLMDTSLPATERAAIESIVEARLGEALEFHDLRARRAGSRTFVDFHLVVSGTMTVATSHALCDRLEEAIAAHAPDAEVVIHVEPETERRLTRPSP
jgi:cation diffusion facilitator family transporter